MRYPFMKTEDIVVEARPPRPRRRLLWFMAGAGAGVAALFFFDSQRGAARRQMLVDQVRARANDAVEVAEKLADTGTTGPQA